MTKIATRTVEYPINLESSTIVIAVAQIEGPTPNGKHESMFGDRDTLVWKSSEDVTSRIDKACGILDALDRLSKKADVVVFPEYSIPIEKALPRIIEKANQYGQIVIAGADSIYQPKTNQILNQCPIIIPGREDPIWVTKREPSKWEQGLIDQPTEVTLPVLTWEANGERHWLSVYICLDFMLAPYEINEGGGIALVPMCSPEIYSFRGWADMLLRLDKGAATVLCNCVDQNAKGQSGVTAVVPDGRPFKSAFSLPESEEAVALLELDCLSLAPPKITNLDFKYPLGERHTYALQMMPEGLDLIPLNIGRRDIVTRAVINPAIFKFLEKSMRVAFLSVVDFARVAESVKDQDFEVLAILGHHDLMVTHIHEKRYNMIYDLTQVISWKTVPGVVFKPGDLVTGPIEDHFPFFKVDVYFKVLGVPVGPAERGAFRGPDKKVPTLQELTQIMKLGNDWNDIDVTEDARNEFLKRKWILARTTTPPGKISSIMTIFLDRAGAPLENLQEDFEDRVLPVLVKNPVVTSIYRGRPQGLVMDYVLRISADVEEALYSLIREVHKLAADAKMLITTRTYVMVQKLSNLSLEKAVLVPVLPSDETNYRNSHIYPRLSPDEKIRAVYLDEGEQRPFINQYRRIQEAISSLGEQENLIGNVAEFERKLATGLLNKDFTVLKEPHDVLQIKVENLLRDFINKKVNEDQLDGWKGPLNILPGKKKNSLSYTERIKLVIRVGEETGMQPALLESVKHLMGSIQMRNAFAHSNWEKLSLEEYIIVLPIYCDFLSKWTSKKLS
jgi:hypothetical protein